MCKNEKNNKKNEKKVADKLLLYTFFAIFAKCLLKLLVIILKNRRQ